MHIVFFVLKFCVIVISYMFVSVLVKKLGERYFTIVEEYTSETDRNSYRYVTNTEFQVFYTYWPVGVIAFLVNYFICNVIKSLKTIYKFLDRRLDFILNKVLGPNKNLGKTK